MRLCVFCGSSLGADPAYARAAAQLGTRLGRRGVGLMYGAAPCEQLLPRRTACDHRRAALRGSHLAPMICRTACS